MLKQHMELSMSVRRTIENNEEAVIRPSKTFQSFVAAARGHCELNFIEKGVRNYITREVWNVSEQEDAKEFGKYLLRMKEKNQNFFFELELEDDQSIKLSRAACEYFGNVISFDTTYNKNRNWNDFLLKYGLVDNKWLSDLYKDRHIWVPIYLDYHLWAGMRSTQKSEKSKESTAILHRAYDNVMLEIEQLKAKRKGTCSLSHEDANLESVNELQSPPRVRTRGCPKNRLGSIG
ncbi:hypothetical protein Ahy_A10g050960 [Arachis hypogaea]|uniref:Uncharacterized protein n=1 Tax=Arachis hypogaea TaxID=3818 RepID=A0A445BAZ6_ARAHY|nr:hypothetical protein Ahy_A10g050960 [Arachis hypogaea]